MAKISAQKLKEIEAAEQKFRPLDTPKTSRPFPQSGHGEARSQEESHQGETQEKVNRNVLPPRFMLLLTEKFTAKGGFTWEAEAEAWAAATAWAEAQQRSHRRYR